MSSRLRSRPIIQCSLVRTRQITLKQWAIVDDKTVTFEAVLSELIRCFCFICVKQNKTQPGRILWLLYSLCFLNLEPTKPNSPVCGPITHAHSFLLYTSSNKRTVYDCKTPASYKGTGINHVRNSIQRINLPWMGLNVTNEAKRADDNTGRNRIRVMHIYIYIYHIFKHY